MQRPPEVDRYLRHFPKVQWDRSLEVALLIGIQAVYKRFPYGFTLDMLQKAAFQQPEAQLEAFKRPSDSPGNLTGRSYGTDQPSRTSPQRRELPDSKRLRIPEKPRVESAHHSHAEAKRLPKHLKEVTSKIREEVQRDIQKYHSPERKDTLQIDDSAWETRIKSYPAPQSKPSSANSSQLVEPRTNHAFAEQLGARVPSESNVLRITDRFLADSFLATLSSQTSPTADPRLWA